MEAYNKEKKEMNRQKLQEESGSLDRDQVAGNPADTPWNWSKGPLPL